MAWRNIGGTLAWLGLALGGPGPSKKKRFLAGASCYRLPATRAAGAGPVRPKSPRAIVLPGPGAESWCFDAEGFSFTIEGWSVYPTFLRLPNFCVDQTFLHLSNVCVYSAHDATPPSTVCMIQTPPGCLARAELSGPWITLLKEIP